MDLERAMQFILEQQARFNSELDQWRLRQLEFEAQVQERVDKAQRRMDEASAKHNQEMAEIRAELRRAVLLSVEEQRRERVRRQETEARLNERMDQISAAQLENERLLKEVLAALKPPRNGH